MRAARHAGAAIAIIAVAVSTSTTAPNVCRVLRPHTVQHASAGAEHRGQRKTDDDAGPDDARGAPHDEPEPIAETRAKRHAHADSAHPLRHRRRQDAEDADHREPAYSMENLTLRATEYESA